MPSPSPVWTPEKAGRGLDYHAPGNPGWVSPRRLDYLPLNDRLAVVRLLAGLGGGAAPGQAALVVGTPRSILRTPLLGSVTHHASRRRVADELLWRATFAVPLELVEYPQAIFGLVATGQLAARLPAPMLATLAALSEPWPIYDRGSWLVHSALLRRATALGTAIAVAGSGIAAPAAALAAGSHAGHARRAVVLAPAHTSAHRQTAAQHAPAPTPAPKPAPAPSTPDSAPASPAPATPGPQPQPRHAPAHHAPTREQVLNRHHSHHHSRAAGSGTPSGDPAQQHPGGAGTPHATSPDSAVSRPAPTQTPGTPHAHHVSSHHDSSAAHHHHRPATSQGSGGTGLSALSPTPPTGLTGSSAGSGHSRPADAVTGTHHRHHADRPAPRDHSHSRHSHHPGHHHPHGGADHHPASGGAAPSTPPTPHPGRSSSPAPPSHLDQDDSAGITTGGTSSGGFVSSGYLSSSTIWTPWTGANSIALSVLKQQPGLFGSVNKPPSFLIKIYKEAGARYHIPWPILAAINSVETNYGHDLAISPAGAEGWMQFMPATWQQYGVAVDHPGAPNPFNPMDAIFAAARYLDANGGHKHLRRAIFAYNHANWYVDEVLWRASVINALAHGHPAKGFANPFPGGWIPNRLDMGYDGTFGHLLSAPVSGTITYAAQSFSNWGGYIELRADHPIKGLPTRTLYFAEGLAPLFKAGTHVKAGTPIAKPSPSPYGDAYRTTGGGQGQIEWGVAANGPTGSPTNPLAETGVANPVRMVRSFAMWVVGHLGVAPPAATDHAGAA